MLALCRMLAAADSARGRRADGAGGQRRSGKVDLALVAASPVDAPLATLRAPGPLRRSQGAGFGARACRGPIRLTSTPGRHDYPAHFLSGGAAPSSPQTPLAADCPPTPFYESFDDATVVTIKASPSVHARLPRPPTVFAPPHPHPSTPCHLFVSGGQPRVVPATQGEHLSRRAHFAGQSPRAYPPSPSTHTHALLRVRRRSPRRVPRPCRE